MSFASTPELLSAATTAACALLAFASASSMVLPDAVADIETVSVSGVPVTVPLPVTVMPVLVPAGGPPPPVALLRVPMGDDGRLLDALPDLGFAGVVIEGMGAGHVHADVAPRLGELARRIPVVLAARPAAGLVFTRTYGYPGGEIDLVDRGLIPAGYLSGTKARLLLGLVLRNGDRDAVAAAFAPYQ